MHENFMITPTLRSIQAHFCTIIAPSSVYYYYYYTGSPTPDPMLRSMHVNPLLYQYTQYVLAFIPAVRHLLTASGTLDLGGSMSDIRPTKQRLEMGKFN